LHLLLLLLLLLLLGRERHIVLLDAEMSFVERVEHFRSDLAGVVESDNGAHFARGEKLGVSRSVGVASSGVQLFRLDQL
jgi:hypothetical protein